MQTLIAEWYRIEDESTRIGYQRVCGKLDAMMRRVRSPLENAGEQFNRFGGDRERGHVRAGQAYFAAAAELGVRAVSPWSSCVMMRCTRARFFSMCLM